MAQFQTWIQFWYQPTMFWKKKEEEQMMSSMFPWLNESQTKWVLEQADKQWITDPSEKIKVQNEIYRQALPVVKEREAKKQRVSAKNEFFNASFNEKDLQQSKQKLAQLKVEDLADYIKDKYKLNPLAPTDKVMEWFAKELSDKQIDPTLIEDYINGKNDELLYAAELKERLPEPKQMAKREQNLDRKSVV